MIERHYTTAQLAERLSVHPETIRRAARRGDLRSMRVGVDRRYPESAVSEWLERLTQRAAAS
jgi:excisionase family DNA binding protein